MARSSEYMAVATTIGVKRRVGLRARTAALAVPLLVIAAAAAPAAGAPTATATIAPISPNPGSYVVTVKNTGSEPIENYSVLMGAEPTGVEPSTCRTGVVSGIFCQIVVPVGGESQMCYSGPAAMEVWLNGPVTHVVPTVAPAVFACGLPNFTCRVPKVANKTLTAAENALRKAKCTVGKIKKAKSSHVKKGRVISSSPPAGSVYASSKKVNLVVSRGNR
ncbi:MAG: hypothetical protein JWN32_1958 [Solirubrobacterales bacterium]|jgi:hypothetical protein|nr:hypothetical protein [Solirubrobacterales bacterium]